MAVRIFRGRNIHEAMAEVKNSLGPDAMIVNSRQSVSADRIPYFEIEAVGSGMDIACKKETGSAADNIQDPIRIDDILTILDQHTQGIMEQLITHPQSFSLYAKMMKSGIIERNARLFIEKAGITNDKPPSSKVSLPQRTIDAIASAIPVTELFPAVNGLPSVAALIGTTGVGKTTTIAKIAAQLMLKDRKKVGLISVDTYRIGAFEQLAVYAKILGISCYQAFKKNDLKSALSRMSDYDVILIDTAGQSQYDLKRIRELRSLLTGDLSISCHLCLSVGTDASGMHQTVRNFSPLNIDSFIFTKVDETKRRGSIVNQLIKTPHPVSYLTTGQSVPEDIEKADRKKIIRLLFNKN